MKPNNRGLCEPPPLPSLFSLKAAQRLLNDQRMRVRSSTIRDPTPCPPPLLIFDARNK